MNRVPLYAKAECTDGTFGESVTVVVNPVSGKVTHLVVQHPRIPAPAQRLVPMDQVFETTPDLVRLRCTQEELAQMPPFIETHYVETEAIQEYPTAFYGGDPTWESHYYLSPYVTMPQTRSIPVDEELVPPGEVAVHRGTLVEAVDGYIGRVRDLVIDPHSERISHFVLQRGHLWGKQEITLPLTAIDRVLDDTAYLKLDKQSVGLLPVIPVKRHYLTGRADIELVARVFDDPETARDALRFVEDLHRRKTIKIHNAALMIKEQDGTTSIADTRDINPRKGRLMGAVTGGLIGALGGPGGIILGGLTGAVTGGAAGKRIDLGFSDKFLEHLQAHLQPGKSALIVLVEHEMARALSEALAGEEGVIVQQTLTDTLVEEFLASSDVPAQGS
jgi:uncharacterized membrane protein